MKAARFGEQIGSEYKRVQDDNSFGSRHQSARDKNRVILILMPQLSISFADVLT